MAELFRAGIDAGDWSTNFAKHSVPYSEIFSGGVPKDGIPAIDNPKFISVVEADKWLEDAEPVLIFEHGGDVRAYPAQIMIWHEIVNDIVGGRPVAVTYCPLCNTAITFDATIDGRRQTFGTTGNLRFSDLVMYDRETESWWQQITGEAIVGARTGSDLTFLPSPMISWAEFKESHADGKVLSRDTGFSRSYGVNPYTGYDTSAPFLFSGPEDDRLPLTERVAGVVVNDDSIAFPFSELAKASVVHSTVGGKDIVVFYKKGTASALDARTISEGRDVGSTGVFLPEVDGKKLTFESADGSFVDRETGTRWNILGQGTEGELKGKKLEPVVHANHFWFSWAVFKPDTKVFKS